MDLLWLFIVIIKIILVETKLQYIYFIPTLLYCNKHKNLIHIYTLPSYLRIVVYTNVIVVLDININCIAGYFDGGELYLAILAVSIASAISKHRHHIAPPFQETAYVVIWRLQRELKLGNYNFWILPYNCIGTNHRLSI